MHELGLGVQCPACPGPCHLLSIMHQASPGFLLSRHTGLSLEPLGFTTPQGLCTGSFLSLDPSHSTLLTWLTSAPTPALRLAITPSGKAFPDLLDWTSSAPHSQHQYLSVRSLTTITPFHSLCSSPTNSGRPHYTRGFIRTENGSMCH